CRQRGVALLVVREVRIALTSKNGLRSADLLARGVPLGAQRCGSRCLPSLLCRV
nr:hypothetical protein [Tanacetum cinerariifolium]